jgi:hypothetical protein
VPHRLPLDLVKMDGSLAQGCQTSARQRAILKSILGPGVAIGQGLHFAQQAVASWRKEHGHA